MNLGNFFRERRDRSGRTQTDIARAVGVSQNTVSKWETDQARPTGVHLTRLLVELGIDSDDYAAHVHDDAVVAAVARVAAALERMAAALERMPG